MIDLDIRAFFDCVPHDLLVKAVAHHTDERWVLLYIERWLKAPMQMADGTLAAREKGTPQGSPISPVLANLFMHYAFDRWMDREYPGCPFERYADDIVDPLRHRGSGPNTCGLRSPSGSSPWGSSCTPRRPRSCTARTRTARGGRAHQLRLPRATPSGAAWPRARGPLHRVLSGHQHQGEEGERPDRSGPGTSTAAAGSDLSSLAEDINPQVRGWINYYGAFYRSELRFLAWRINEHLVRWAMQQVQATSEDATPGRWTGWSTCTSTSQPDLFAHWQLAPLTEADLWEPDDGRLSRPVLREPGGAIPPGHSPYLPTKGYSARPRSETALWRSTLDTVQSPFLPRCLPSIKLTPTQWFRYHWRYTTSTAWGRTSRNRSLRERPHWNAANVTAMAEVAEALRLLDVLRQYSPQPSAPGVGRRSLGAKRSVAPDRGASLEAGSVAN